MNALWMLPLAALLAPQNTDDEKEWKKTVKAFEGKCRSGDPEKRLTAFREFLPLPNAKALPVIEERLEWESEDRQGADAVALEILKHLSQYPLEAEAARILSDFLAKGEMGKKPELQGQALQSFGSLNPKLTRPLVEPLHKLTDHKKVDVAKLATEVLGIVGAKDSITVLMENMRKNQEHMKTYFGPNQPGCDGG